MSELDDLAKVLATGQPSFAWYVPFGWWRDGVRIWADNLLLVSIYHLSRAASLWRR